MNNKKLGNEFEREFEQMLRERGFWVHFMSPNAAGAQPTDFICVKNGKAYLIDCKTSVKDKFSIIRLEDNQKLAFEKWKKCGNGGCYIAVKYNEQIYMIPYWILSQNSVIGLNDPYYLFDSWITFAGETR